MRLVTLLAAGLLSIAAAATQPSASFAATPPRVSGQACSSLARVDNVWRASYWAWTKDVNDQLYDFMESPCFTSAASCEAWFYWAQSDWPDQIAIQHCNKIS